MAALLRLDPIFVHASMRSGSTYFFNVLRRDDTLICFNEAIIDGKKDYARFKNIRKRNPDRRSQTRRWDANHHFLDRPDFAEFIEAWDAVMHLCPEFPEFQDYLPPEGVLSSDLTVYLSALVKYAQSQNKRPVLCEVNSRGRAAALRATFGGLHIAQFRDPLSQFGSFIRGLLDGGTWSFLAFPAMELGTSANHPLYRIVPDIWRAPDLPWRAQTRALRWASDAEYVATVASPRPESIEKLFRWHLFSWFLSNLAAISYSDLILDIDKVHDDADYRASVVDKLARELNSLPDLTDLRKFDRYYEFESFDIKAVCWEIAATIVDSLHDGRLEKAINMLGRQTPTTPAAMAVELLVTKLRASLDSMARSADRRYMRIEEWRMIAEKNRRIWFNPIVRRVAEHVYPLAAPVVHAARRAGLLH